MKTEALLTDLIERTKGVLNSSENFNSLDNETLNFKPSATSWSILECIEHLNLYGDFYLPEIENRIKNSKHQASHTFKTGILGNYFAKSLLPREKLNKMNAFKDKNPNGSHLDKRVLDKFIHQQHETLRLLNLSRTTNLTKTKTSITLTNYIKIRLGDTFRVLIYHNQRHIVQAEKVLKAFKS